MEYKICDLANTLDISAPLSIKIDYNNNYDNACLGQWSTTTCDRKYEEKRKEEKNMGEDFLKIKKEQEFRKLEKDKYVKIREIQETDPIVKIMKEAQKNIMAIEENCIGYSFPTYNYYTKETSKKIDEIHKKYSEKEDKIVAKYQEIAALCNGASWEERMKIYKIYGIVED